MNENFIQGSLEMINLTKSKMNQYDYRDWISYFQENNHQRLDIDFSQEKQLSASECDLIFPSIKAFQKGEGSDGRHLMKAARRFIQEYKETDYQEAVQWFIREENWHSAYLRTFMDFYHVKTAKKSLPDKLFRKLRQTGGIKSEITILVTAEIIALTYYDALSKSTESSALKSICSQMLKDELPHIIFQSYTLSRLKKRAFDKVIRIMIMELTMLFVWLLFHNVYQAGGYSFVQFLKASMGYLRQSIVLVEQNRESSPY